MGKPKDMEWKKASKALRKTAEGGNEGAVQARIARLSSVHLEKLVANLDEWDRQGLGSERARGLIRPLAIARFKALNASRVDSSGPVEKMTDEPVVEATLPTTGPSVQRSTLRQPLQPSPPAAAVAAKTAARSALAAPTTAQVAAVTASKGSQTPPRPAPGPRRPRRGRPASTARAYRSAESR